MRKLVVIGCLLLSTVLSWSQEAYIQIDTNTLRIGEQTTLHIFFNYQDPSGDALIGWPQFDDQLTDDIEIIDKTIDYAELIDSASSTYLREQKLVITAFEYGLYAIPPIEIELNDSSYFTNDDQLLVQTVEVDTSKGIYDIKPNYSVNYSFGERTADWLKENWIWFALIGLLIAIYFIYRLIKNRKKDEETEVYIPKIPAHITALKILNQLLSREEWKSPEKKEYYSQLTDTVRRYLEERFGIYAMEQTTREIINDLKNADISEEDKAYLRQILNQADMVKFAKFKPNDEDGHTSLNQSIDFVKRTKKEEEEGE